jgi:hypothetical protein
VRGSTGSRINLVCGYLRRRRAGIDAVARKAIARHL